MKTTNINDLLSFFEEIPTFESLPILYRDKIINFFSEDRHYMVDPSDVQIFLETGSHFTELVTLEHLLQYCKTNTPKGILACKRVWSSMDSFAEWAHVIQNLANDDTDIIFLTHCIEYPSDIADEWYFVS